MARWTSLTHTEDVLVQAERWKNRCLIGTGSVFTNKEIWTPANVATLKTLFVDNPILGNQTFYEKLNLQLKDAEPDVCRLAAEALWLLLLFVSKDSFGVETKVGRLRELWALSGEEFPDTPALNEAAMSGLANPGTAFLTKIWAEYGYVLEALNAWKEPGKGGDASLLQNRPWEFCEWVTGIEGGSARSARHMLLYFCYPDYFERISSRNSKKKIYETFKDKLAGNDDAFEGAKSPCNLDRSIYQIRLKLEEERGSKQLDFFHGDLKNEWVSSGHAPSGDSDQDETDTDAPPFRVWVEKCHVKGRPDRQTGNHRLGEALWSPQRAKNGGDFYSNMRRVEPGDIVLHLTDNAAFTGISDVAEPVDDTFVGLSGTDWADEPGYRVQLRNFRPLDPELPRVAFLIEGDVGTKLRAILHGPDGKGLFYNRKLELNQGAYLSEAPPSLISVLNEVYESIAGRKLVNIQEQPGPDLDSARKRFAVTQSLNTIFYGPPGTGKTYITARRAVEICDGGFSGSDEALRARYEQLVKQRRIEFVTFHQTYGYEEFVEGLRPDTSASEDGETGPGFRLQDRPGVLKRIAERARKLPSGTGQTFDPAGRKVFKVSLGRSTEPQDDYLREECLENGYVLLGYGGEVDWSSDEYDSYDAIANRWRQESGEEEAHGNSPNILFPFQLRVAMREGDLVLASRGNRRLQAVGIVSGPYDFKKRENDEYHHKRPVKWLWKDETGDGIPVSDVLDRNFSQQSIYGITPKPGVINWDALLPYLQEKATSDPPPPHVLIIDEINRANISKVMGELITLLEEDKRAGAPNEIAVTLPHSGEQFTLPANLHIIGTMNTADRSIALLDTALRRRFQFEEMPPNPSVLNPVDGIDVALVLERLNSRLEWFLGSDQLIGHAWFMRAKTLPELDAVIANKIIPLLREYFHEDVNRVRAVLGGGDGFLKGQKIPTPPGIDDYGDNRYRFVDQYSVAGTYGHAAYQEVIDGVASNGAG